MQDPTFAMFLRNLAADEDSGGGDDTVGKTLIELKFLNSSFSSSNFSIRAFRARISKFELFELVLLLKLDKQLPVERFEAAVPQSAVPSPPLKLLVDAPSDIQV